MSNILASDSLRQVIAVKLNADYKSANNKMALIKRNKVPTDNSPTRPFAEYDYWQKGGCKKVKLQQLWYCASGGCY